MIKQITNRELYKDKYKEDITVSDHVSDTDFRKIVTGYLKFMMDKVIAGYDVEFDNVGVFLVKGKIVDPKLNEAGELEGIVNWAATRKLWKEDKEAFEKNSKILYTNNKVYKISWDKTGIRMHNKELYVLSPTKTNKLSLIQSIRAGTEYYVQPKKAS